MSKYVPPAKRNSASGISQNKLFVGNLTGTTTKQDLVDLFAKIAAPLEVSIINPGFNKQKTIAFVTFANTVDLNEICLKMKLTMLNGILLEISLPKDKQLGFGSKGNHDFVKGNCLRCSSPGHISRNCPVAESSCYKCGGEHLGRYCIGKYAFIERITIPDAEYPDVTRTKGIHVEKYYEK